ncbi:MAG: hypothetical protein OXC30_03370 [Alphaproteobacteria bacterium]|nr:hypothetical protein [Alphaproteobacteria bacterium]
MIFLLLFFMALDADSASEASSDESLSDSAACHLLDDRAVIIWPADNPSSSDDESNPAKPISQVLLSAPLEDSAAERRRFMSKNAHLLDISLLKATWQPKCEQHDTLLLLGNLHDLMKEITLDLEKFLFAEIHARRFPFNDEQRLVAVPYPLDLKTFLTNLKISQLDLETFFYIFSAFKEVYASVSSKHSDRESCDTAYKDACVCLLSSFHGFCRQSVFWYRSKFKQFTDALSPLL